MQDKEYMQVMIQSLTKKKAVLEGICEDNLRQKDLLKTDAPDIDEWEAIVKEKAEKIDQLNLLDDGFNSLYQRVREELTKNREQYAEEIRSMQKLITGITELIVNIEAQEARNKELAAAQFSKMKKQVRQVKQTSKAAEAYRNNMKKINVVDPYFVDRKE